MASKHITKYAGEDAAAADASSNSTPKPAVLHCGASLTHLARTCPDAFRGSVGSLSEQHRSALQTVMRIAMTRPNTQTQIQPQTNTHTQASSTQINNPNTPIRPVQGVSGVTTPHTEAPSPVPNTPTPLGGLGGLKFDVSGFLVDEYLLFFVILLFP
jgi:hypothetical protein